MLSKLLLEQEYMETMHCSLQGAGSVFHTTLRCERETICTNLMMKAINAWWTYIVTITTTLYGPASVVPPPCGGGRGLLPFYVDKRPCKASTPYPPYHWGGGP